MVVRSAVDVKQDKVKAEGAEGVKIRWLISAGDGAPNFAMREFEVEPGGHTPYHSHEWEHELYVLNGEGVAVEEGEEKPIRKGSVIFVPPNKMHNFANTGSETMRFLCLVPHKRDT